MGATFPHMRAPSAPAEWKRWPARASQACRHQCARGWDAWDFWDAPGRARVRICCKGAPGRARRGRPGGRRARRPTRDRPPRPVRGRRLSKSATKAPIEPERRRRIVDIPRFFSPPIPARGAFATDSDTSPPRTAPGAPPVPPRARPLPSPRRSGPTDHHSRRERLIKADDHRDPRALRI